MKKLKSQLTVFLFKLILFLVIKESQTTNFSSNIKSTRKQYHDDLENERIAICCEASPVKNSNFISHKPYLSQTNKSEGILFWFLVDLINNNKI